MSMLPSGVHFRNHAQELQLLRTGPQRIALLLLLVALAIFPFIANTYMIGIAITMAIPII